MSNPIKLYNFPKSGHAHRIELMLSLLNLPTELVFVDLAKGAHKQPDFLALNPFGQVPVIDDNGTVIADSNAILVYLAKKYDNGTWLPEEPAADTVHLAKGCLDAANTGCARHPLDWQTDG